MNMRMGRKMKGERENVYEGTKLKINHYLTFDFQLYLSKEKNSRRLLE